MILVTGGAGFIGSNLVAALADAGRHDVVVCDAFGQDDKWRNLAKHEVLDIVPPEKIETFLETRKHEIEVIFHLGAISSTTERDVDLILERNFAYSRTLWNWAAEHGVRFIYASSAATYGDGSFGFEDTQCPDHLSRLRPLNPYGWSKHLFDRAVCRMVQNNAARAKNGAVPPQWAGLKFFNVYGPNEYHKGDQMSVVARLYPQIVSGARAKLFKSYRPDYADGGQIRDFIWVGDCVRVMLWLLQNPDICGLFNVGTGQGRSFHDLAQATFVAAERPAKIEYIDMPDGLKEKYQYFTQANMQKLQQAGYTRPFTSLEEGIRQYVQDYLAKEDPYR